MRVPALGLLVALGTLPVSSVMGQTSPAAPVPNPSLSVAGSPNIGTLDDAKSAEQLHEEGVRLLREHQTEAAIQLFHRAVALNDKSALYVTDLGYAYLKQRRLIEAENAFKKGILLDPTRPHAYEHLEQSITQQPLRWEKRQELLRILEQGLGAIKDRQVALRLELARIRAERSFGLAERARGHVEELLRQKKLPRVFEKQIQELNSSIEQDKKARALRDWPEPEVNQKDRALFLECARKQELQHRKEALPTLAQLLQKNPAWHAPRKLRAVILSEQGHYDEAVKELTILTRLAPSEPVYHRQLGILLAEHGGLLELERADEALRVALALEPEWSELEPMRQKLAARRYDSPTSNRQANQQAPSPTENATRLYNEAEASLEEAPTDHAVAKTLLDQALRESPTYVEAAALLYSLTQRIQETTVRALWNDASGMFALYQEFSHVEPPAPRVNLESWLNRAIDLGHVEGRLSRALNAKNHGDMAAAEVDLASYLALVSNNEEVDAVRLLRAELGDKRQNPGLDALLNARLRLQRDDPEGALRILEAPCRANMEPERLLALGIVYERLGRNGEALGCYEIQLGKAEKAESTERIERRLARLLARAESKWFEHPAAARLPQLDALEPAALWALARRALETGKADEAEGYALRYLTQASPEDRFVAEAKALKQRLLQKAEQQREGKLNQRRLLLSVAGTGLLLLAAVIYLLLFRGCTVARALRRRPRLFPALSRIVGELRHDVLKHRTSALELYKNDQTSVEKLQRTMLSPVPTSVVVTEAYARLVSTARAEGITLRRLQREPVFGRLVKDLLVVERTLTSGGDKQTIMAVDERLRTCHKERLSQLIALGPRCQLDAAEIQRWIAALEVEFAGNRQNWIVPALQMSDLSLWFPVDKATLFQLFANLLRNAEAAVGSVASPKVRVSLVSTIDFTGKPLVRFQIADNGPGELKEESIEAQDPGRGLGIVRDTVRDWAGHWVIAQENEPYRKSIGLEFAQ